MGIRAVALVTEVFRSLAQLTAHTLCLPTDRIVFFPHPLNSRSDERIAELSDDRFPLLKERLGLG
jgi:hypothetical protein